MIRHYESIEELSIELAEFLSNLAQVSQNVNDDILKIVLEDYMKDYVANRDLINNRLKLEKKLVLIQNREEYKNKLLNVRYEAKQSRYLRFRHWLLNFRLYRLFKKQIKMKSKKEYSDKITELEKLEKELKTSIDFNKNKSNAN